MAIEFLCSQCRCELRVNEDAVGKKARCPRCGMIHDVPDNPGSPPGDASVDKKAGQYSDASESRDTVYHSPVWDSERFVETGHVESGPGFRDAAGSVGENSGDRFEISDAGSRWSMKTPDGAVYGPVHQSEMDQWANQGRLSSDCLVQMEGQSHWQSALVLYPQLADMRRRPAAAARAGISPHALQARAHVGTQPAPPRGPRPNSGLTVFILSIIGVFFLIFPIFSLIAFFMARAERRGIRDGQVNHSGRGLLDTGYVISIISLILSALMVFGCCALSTQF